MIAMSAQESAAMETDGKQIRQRRTWLGMTVEDLAKEAGVSPDTLSDFETGQRKPRDLTIAKVVAALDRIEEEVGKNAPPAEPSSGLVEFDITGDFGVHVVVKGPVGDADALQRQVIEIIREIRKGDTPKDR